MPTRQFRYNSIIGRLGIIFLGVLICLTSATAQSKKITLDDIFALRSVSDIELSPDGKNIVYVQQQPGRKNVYKEISNLWLLNVKTKEIWQLTNGKNDSLPRWSPDNHTIAFLSTRSESSQIWLIDTKGGEARQLTGVENDNLQVNGSITNMCWSPDGKKIAYIFMQAEDKKKRNELPKTIVASKMPQFFTWNPITESFIEVIEVSSRKRMMLTEKHLNFGGDRFLSLQWSPSGKSILFADIPTAKLSTDIWNESDVYTVSVMTKEVKKIGGQKLTDYLPVWSPGGTKIAYISDNGITGYESSRSIRICTYPGQQHHTVSGSYINVTVNLPLFWQKDNLIYFGGNDHATARVHVLSPSKGEIRQVTPDNMYVRDYSLSADGTKMAVLFENVNTPTDIYLGNPSTGKYERLTDLNPEIRTLQFGSVDIIRWRSNDNRFIVEGFLVKPPNFRKGKRYPLLVNVHGGPRATYLNAFFDLNFHSGYHSPAQIYATEGYLVLLPNPRGDYSYSKEYTDSFRKDWGKGDYNNDVDAGIDYLIEQGFVDPDRLGIMGFSYGGYLTAWAVTQTNRFKAASINEAFLNLISSYGQCYPNFKEFYDYFFGGNPYEERELFIDRSPIAHAAKIKTPILLRFGSKMSGIKPMGMGLHQGKELYAALKEHNVPVELIVHPEEGHGLLEMETYRDYVKRNIEWFNYWVLGKGKNPLE